jgi:hypothetical protein
MGLQKGESARLMGIVTVRISDEGNPVQHSLWYNSQQGTCLCRISNALKQILSYIHWSQTNQDTKLLLCAFCSFCHLLSSANTIIITKRTDGVHPSDMCIERMDKNLYLLPFKVAGTSWSVRMTIPPILVN